MEDLFDRLTEEFFGDWERPFWRAEGWAPPIESHVENGNLVVKAELPGIDPKEVSISVVGNELKIEGERKGEEKREEKDYYYRELHHGKFSRIIPLPEGVNTEEIKANYHEGMLEITMPAPKGIAAKRIPIEAK
jgi:HSP20 family protein